MASVARDAGRRSPVRVLWLIDSLNLGGAEALVARFARAAPRERISLRVCCLKSIGGNPLAAELDAAGIPWLNLGARNLRDVGAFRRLVRLVRTEGVDLIHAHLTYASIWSALISRLTGIPFVATLHVDPTSGRRWSREGVREWLMCRLLARYAAAVIAVSEALREAYVRAGLLAAELITVVRNGIDAQGPRPAPGTGERLRAALGLRGDARVVTTVAVLRPEKGLDVLVRAARVVRQTIPQARFLIAGEGPARSDLQQQTEQAGLGGVVMWLGFRRDVYELLAASDLFVLPTRRDAFPTVLLEAMAAGLAVVASDVGGIPEMVRPGTGLLVPAGDSRALGEAIASLLGDAAESSRLGDGGRKRVREEFSYAVWIAGLEAVYRKALERSLKATTPAEVERPIAS